MRRLQVAVLATSALTLVACTGLQGGSEPHDDDGSGIDLAVDTARTQRPPSSGASLGSGGSATAKKSEAAG